MGCPIDAEGRDSLTGAVGNERLDRLVAIAAWRAPAIGADGTVYFSVDVSWMHDRACAN